MLPKNWEYGWRRGTKILDNITVIPLVPPVALQLAKNPIVDNYDVSSIKCIINSAAALTAEVAELVNKRLNASVKQGYGLTETTFATHYTSGSVKAGAIGKLLPFVEAKIADIETNTSLGPNQDGEILVRGPLIMKGYRHNIEETRNCIDENGWLHTGDIGYYDDSLCFWYKDRKKELIKYNANQVPPAELEGLLAAHPEVVDAAVVGVPDATSGELPRAYIVKRKDSNVTANQIADYIAENVAPFKKLRGGVVFTDIIPRSASGKILRRELKAKMMKELK
ncbi:hypothetical protein QYM36_015012 [Artemia franciscana]|uniref:Uncharacterized protein n=1 Tax=Artemia franciscana TaxID=6661 RepID=A0AA88H933_ARTSF|nr:hypothetical protein QYM36_015012 [Artemia franciscana]